MKSKTIGKKSFRNDEITKTRKYFSDLPGLKKHQLYKEFVKSCTAHEKHLYKYVNNYMQELKQVELFTEKQRIEIFSNIYRATKFYIILIFTIISERYDRATRFEKKNARKDFMKSYGKGVITFIIDSLVMDSHNPFYNFIKTDFKKIKEDSSERNRRKTIAKERKQLKEDDPSLKDYKEVTRLQYLNNLTLMNACNNYFKKGEQHNNYQRTYNWTKRNNSKVQSWIEEFKNEKASPILTLPIDN